MMKLRKLLALVLTLSVCASLMAPMASAAYPESGENNNTYKTITLTPELTSAGSGTYDVKLTATLKMDADGVAKTIAAYISSRNSADKLSSIRFVCGLKATNIVAMAGTFEYDMNADAQATFVVDPDHTDGANGSDLIEFYLKLNPDKILAWANLSGTVDEVKDAIAQDLAKEISFSTSRTGVQVTFGKIYAYVDVFAGDTQYASRIAWGQYNLTDPNASSDDDDTPSSVPSSGDSDEPEIEAVVIDEDGNEQPADKPAAEVINSVEIEEDDDDDATTLTFTPNNNIIAHNGGRARMVTKIIDKETGLPIYDSTEAAVANLPVGATAGTSSGAVVTIGKNGETIVTFTMPEDGVQFVVEYESVPYTPEESGVDSLLITEEHVPYVKGDGNGNFRPNDKITRSEVATMIYRLLRDKNVETTVSFSDVQEGAWYYDAVMTLASLGILKGAYGQFRPTDTITREEFTAICVRFATKQPEAAGKEFADISSTDWSHEEVAMAAALGWVIGYPDGMFLPDRALTRAEAVTLLNRVLGRPGDTAAISAGKGVSFGDLKTTFWGYNAIVEAATTHGFTMDDDTYTETWVNG